MASTPNMISASVSVPVPFIGGNFRSGAFGTFHRPAALLPAGGAARRQGLPAISLTLHSWCTCTHSPHPPPWPGHSFPDCLLTVYRITRGSSERVWVHWYTLSNQ